MAELSKLHDAVPPFGHDEAMRMLEGELGAPVDAVFEDFSSRPVASASLAQVYRATLRADAPQLAALSGGVREVAVKVQRPNILDEIALDLYVLRLLAPLQVRG